MTTTQTETTETALTIRCRPFGPRSLREHRVLVSGTEEVRVWDPIAGYYTLCHSLTPAAQQRIVRAAIGGAR